MTSLRFDDVNHNAPVVIQLCNPEKYSTVDNGKNFVEMFEKSCFAESEIGFSDVQPITKLSRVLV
jgi:hypothetical protein